MNPKLNRFLVASSDALAVSSSSAWAGNVFKSNSPAALESGTSWTGGIAPKGTGTAYFDASNVSTVGNRTGSLGADVIRGTIRVDGGTGAIAVNSGGGSTITLNGTTADSAYLTWTDIPEPSSALLSGSGMLPLLLRRL